MLFLCVSYCFVFLKSELDTFGYCLYFMLTLMSCVSLLVYLEQCAYIYKKLPYPKKTLVIWVNGAAPVSIQACLSFITCH